MIDVLKRLFLIYILTCGQIHATDRIYTAISDDSNIENYVSPSTGCAIYSVYFSVIKASNKNISIKDIAKEFEEFGNPPYSILDIVSVLERHSLLGKGYRLKSPDMIFSHNFIYGILYLRNFEKEIGHYSFCFRGKDGTLWVADPRFSNRCLKLTSKSEILKFFTGIFIEINKI